MWTFTTDRQDHLDEHNQYDHTDLSSLTEGKVLGVESGIIKQVAALLLAGGTMAGDIDMDNNDIVGLSALQGGTLNLLSLKPGSGHSLRLQDDVGVYRIRIDPNSIGDIMLIDTAGTYRLQWDQSRGTWRMSAHLDMEGSDLLQVGEITGDAAATLIIRPGTAQQLQLRDSGGPTRISMVVSQPLFLHNTSGAAVLAVRDDALDNYNRRFERVLDPTFAQDAATKNYVDTKALLLAGGTMAGDIVMNGNSINMGVASITNLTSITGRDSGPLVFQSDALLPLQLNDGAPLTRLAIQAAQPTFLHDTAGTAVLAIRDDRLDNYDRGIDRVASIKGSASSTLLVTPGTGQELRLQDDTGVDRIQFNVNATGSMLFYDNAGGAVASWNHGLDSWVFLKPINMQLEKIVSLGAPTVDNDAATKKYVDDNSGNPPTTTKGDLSGFSTVAARIPVGTNDDVLTADSTQALGVKWATPAGGSGGLDVTELNSNTILSSSGVYVIDTTSGNITITLPILSGTPSAGYRIQVIRDGANFVYLQTNAADDYWDTTTQRTLFDPYSAVSVAAGVSSTSWLELGRWRTVT